MSPFGTNGFLVVLAILLWLSCPLAQAGGLAAAEYFIGADPGAGNATPVSPVDGVFDTETELLQTAINVSSLPSGVNRIGLRFKGSDGAWGNAVFLDVQVEEAAGLATDPPLIAQGGGAAALRTLVAADYTLDGGTRTGIAPADGTFDSVAEQTLAAAINPMSLSTGPHRVAMRFQDTEGAWGNEAFVDVVVQDAAGLITDPPLIAQGGAAAALRALEAAEYSLDGGTPTTLAAGDGAFDSVAEQTLAAAINPISLSTGMHRVAVRFQDSESRWGNESFIDVVVQNAAGLVTDPPLIAEGGGAVSLRRLAAADYTVDGGIRVPLVSADGAFDSAAEQTLAAAIEPGSLSAGRHRVALRFQDNENRWGNDLFLDLVVQDAAGLVTDPPLLAQGGGAAALRTLAGATYSLDGGSSVALVSRDGAYDTTVEDTLPAVIAPASLSDGPHRIALRFVDSQARWGNEEFVDILVHDVNQLMVEPPLLATNGCASSFRTLAAAEWFVDEDPGKGNGSSMLPADGSFDSVTEFLQDAAPAVPQLAGGAHRVGLRFKDSSGEWGGAIYQGFAVYNPVGEAPSIAVQPPIRQIQAPGSLAVLSVLADGSEPLRFQWLRGNAVIGGATNSSLYLPGVSSGDAGGYSVIVANDYGSITSRVSLLVVRGATYAPEIVGQPVSQTVLLGANVMLSAAVEASWPVYFQWYKEGRLLPAETATNLVFTNAQLADSGVYWLVITNDFGAVTSAPVALNVDAVMAFVDNQPLLGTNTFEGGAIVSLETAFEFGTIFYTANGAAPDFDGTPYSGPFVVNSSCVLRAGVYDETFTEYDEMVPVSITVIPLLQLSVSTAGGGTVALEPPGNAYRRGTPVTAVATPNSGWTFMGWMGDSLSPESTLSLTLTNNRSLQAVFGTSMRTVTTGKGTIIQAPQRALYPYGTPVRLSAVPNKGSYLVTWGGSASGTDNPMDFVIKEPNPTVTCLFGTLPANQYSLTVVPDGFGWVEMSPVGNRFSYGQEVVMTAVPNPGQSFLGWTGDIDGTNNSITLVVKSNCIVGAAFTSLPVLQPDGDNRYVTSEGFRFKVLSDYDASIALFWSSNLVDWARFRTLTNNFGTIRLLDDSSVNQPRRFYRAVQEQ